MSAAQFDSDRFRHLLDSSDVLSSVCEVVATYTAQHDLPGGGQESVIIEVLAMDGDYMTRVRNSRHPERNCSSENMNSSLEYAVANIHWEKMERTPLPE